MAWLLSACAAGGGGGRFGLAARAARPAGGGPACARSPWISAESPSIRSSRRVSRWRTASRIASKSALVGACISLRAFARKSPLVWRKATAWSIHCFIPAWNCGERRNSFQASASACKIPSRIWRSSSGGAELGADAKAVCITFDIDSSQIF